MPWNPSDATRHTKKAKSSHAKAVWSKIANSVLSSGKSDASAIRIANAAIKKRK